VEIVDTTTTRTPRRSIASISERKLPSPVNSTIDRRVTISINVDQLSRQDPFRDDKRAVTESNMSGAGRRIGYVSSLSRTPWIAVVIDWQRAA